jgi:hypothetical protein
MGLGSAGQSRAHSEAVGEGSGQNSHIGDVPRVQVPGYPLWVMVITCLLVWEEEGPNQRQRATKDPEACMSAKAWLP